MIDFTQFFRALVIFNGGFSDFSEIGDVYNGLMALLCVICAGIAAGLTVGLLSLDVTKLEIKSMTGNRDERDAAVRILPIIKKHHLLLVTLLLFNSIANETLPIFLGALVPNYVAVILSVTLVLVFGEIIPSAVFTGPDQLLTASRMTGLVNCLTIVLYPVAYPISRILDWMLGEDEASSDLSRKELEALFVLQSKKSNASSLLSSPKGPGSRSAGEGGTPLLEIAIPECNGIDEECFGDDGEGTTPHAISHQEIHLMTGILRLSKLTVKGAMRTFKSVFMVSNEAVLDEKGLFGIVDSGYSRIPVYRAKDKQHMLGYMLTRDLIGVNPSDNTLVRSMPLRQPVIVGPDTPLLEMLSIFQSGHCHMAFISNQPSLSLRYLQNGERPARNVSLLGIVCMEDVLEKIIQKDITDESDYLRSIRQTDSSSRDMWEAIKRRSSSSGNINRRAASSGSLTDGQTPALPRSSSKSALSTKLLSIGRRPSVSGPAAAPLTLSPRASSSSSGRSAGPSTAPARAYTIGNLLSLVGGGSSSSNSAAKTSAAAAAPGHFPSMDELTDEATEYNTYQNGAGGAAGGGGGGSSLLRPQQQQQSEAFSLLGTARNNSYNFLEMEHSPPNKSSSQPSAASDSSPSSPLTTL